MIRFDPEWGKNMKRYMGMFKVMALIVSLMMVVLGCSTGNSTTSSQTEAPKSSDGATAKPGDTKKIKCSLTQRGQGKTAPGLKAILKPMS
jgi:hypothetical protein